MDGAVCALCSQVVEPDDHYRELDCSRTCEGNVFHELCIERYLRKNGRGGEQKTGFGCPATLPNGKPCLGTIKKTHMRLPMNAKKKEQNKQAAIAVNLMVNATRGVAPTLSTSKEKASVVVKQPATKAGAKVVKIVTGQRPPVVASKWNTGVTAPAANRQDGEARAACLDDFTNFRQIGKRNLKLDDDESDSGSEGGPSRPQKRQSEDGLQGHASRPQKTPTNKAATSRAAPKPAAAAWAISNNSAMAPEPVVRQQPVPGWPESTKASTSVSNLEQQRALVAALRGNTSSANRATSGASTSAGGGARKAVTGSGCMEKAEAQEPTSDGRPNNISASREEDFPVLPTPAVAAASGAATASTALPASGSDTGAAMPPVSPAASAVQQQQLLHRSSSSGDGVSLPSSLTALPDTPDPASPASLAFQDEAQDEDPIVDYDLLLSMQDGTVVVVEKHTGLFLPMESVYGPDPELIGFQDEGGNCTYHVVVRASVAAALLERQQLTQQASGGGASLEGPAGHGAGSVSERVIAPVPDARWAHEPVAAGGGMIWTSSGPQPTGSGLSAVTAYEVDQAGDDEDDFDDLLALCLG